MVANLFMHVRSLPGGRVLATPIPFVDLAWDGATEAEARRAAIAASTERLAKVHGSMRAALSEPAVAHLDAIDLTVGDSGVKVTIGLVVVRRLTTAGPMRLVFAPEIPRFTLAVSEAAPLQETVLPKLAEHVADWPDEVLIACDEIGAVRLSDLPLPFPPDASIDSNTSPPPPGGAIESLADDLTARAAKGGLGRLDRRDTLVERVLAALAADGRSSVLLVGPNDVGKTALIHEVAARLESGAVPPALVGRRLLRLSANELIAGARFTGMWQDRARALITFARETRAIIVMGEPTAIVDAGRWSESTNNLGRVLRPFIEQGDLRLICESTEQGLVATRSWEPSFLEAFYRVDVPEPDSDAVNEILVAAARRLELNHAVAIGADAVEAAIELTARFEPYRAQPGKSVRLLEETVQFAAPSDEAVGREAVTRAFAQRTGMPLAILSDQVQLDPAEVRAFFDERVLGQDEAVDAIVDLILVVKTGLHDPRKPLASLLFVGPTGVGKTELTRVLAEFLFGSRERVIRLDMGEYASGDAVPRLVGSAWRRDDEAALIRRVREQPFCVLLLDEIEKAHRDVFDVLLAALDAGRLTDASGETADLRNAIVVMTSNLGAGKGEHGGLGFADLSDPASRRHSHFVDEAEHFFRPEFFNRIDRLIVFDALGPDALRRIARRELGRILMREGVARRRLQVEVEDGVVEQLATRGADARYGARPLQREIERAIVRPLARLLVQRQPQAGDLVRLRSIAGEIVLDVHAVTDARPTKAKAAAHLPEGGGEPTRRTVAQIAELRERVRAASFSGDANTARDALTSLVDESNHPGFWDEPDRARDVLARLYELQRIFDDLRSLLNRVDGLAELTERQRTTRDRARIAEVRRASDEIEERLQRHGQDQRPCFGVVASRSNCEPSSSRTRISCFIAALPPSPLQAQARAPVLANHATRASAPRPQTRPCAERQRCRATRQRSAVESHRADPHPTTRARPRARPQLAQTSRVVNLSEIVNVHGRRGDPQPAHGAALHAPPPQITTQLPARNHEQPATHLLRATGAHARPPLPRLRERLRRQIQRQLTIQRATSKEHQHRLRLPLIQPHELSRRRHYALRLAQATNL
jgi:ATP-dependent Clp protease ATP-binding subunit ClpA